MCVATEVRPVPPHQSSRVFSNRVRKLVGLDITCGGEGLRLAPNRMIAATSTPWGRLLRLELRHPLARSMRDFASTALAKRCDGRRHSRGIDRLPLMVGGKPVNLHDRIRSAPAPTGTHSPGTSAARAPVTTRTRVSSLSASAVRAGSQVAGRCWQVGRTRCRPKGVTTTDSRRTCGRPRGASALWQPTLGRYRKPCPHEGPHRCAAPAPQAEGCHDPRRRHRRPARNPPATSKRACSPRLENHAEPLDPGGRLPFGHQEPDAHDSLGHSDLDGCINVSSTLLENHKNSPSNAAVYRLDGMASSGPETPSPRAASALVLHPAARAAISLPEPAKVRRLP